MTAQELAQARLEKAREIAADQWEPGYRGFVLKGRYDESSSVKSVIAALILCNWQPPVDPDLLIAREAGAAFWDSRDKPEIAQQMRAGDIDSWAGPTTALAAIKLFKARQS